MNVNLTTVVDLLSDEGLQALYDACMDAASREFDHIRTCEAAAFPQAASTDSGAAYHRARMIELHDAAQYVDGILKTRVSAT